MILKNRQVTTNRSPIKLGLHSKKCFLIYVAADIQQFAFQIFTLLKTVIWTLMYQINYVRYLKIIKFGPLGTKLNNHLKKTREGGLQITSGTELIICDT